MKNNNDTLSRQVGGDHYQKLKIQPAEYIHANGLDFFEGNIVKYISRHRFKNGAEDIKKIIQYCEMILEFDYGEELPVDERKEHKWITVPPKR